MNELTKTVHHEISVVQGRTNADMYMGSAHMFNAVIETLKGRTGDDSSLLFVESSQFECSDGTMLPREYAIKKVCKVDSRVINVASDFGSIYEINSFLKSVDGLAVLAGAVYKTTKQILKDGHWVNWSTEYYKDICTDNKHQRFEIGYNIHSMGIFTACKRIVPLSYFENSAETRMTKLLRIKA